MSVKISPAQLSAQKTFRVLLQALSQPGRVLALPLEAPHQGWRWVLAALLDPEVTFAVLGPEEGAWAEEVRDLTGATPALLSQADFLLIFAGGSRGGILEAKRGSLEYPDQGATLFYLVEEVREGDARQAPVRLRGPGIPRARYPVVAGLDPAEWGYLAEVNGEFPLGVDCFFLDRDNRVMGLPRSTRVEMI